MTTTNIYTNLFLLQENENDLFREGQHQKQSILEATPIINGVFDPDDY